MPVFLETADYERLIKPELLTQLIGGDLVLQEAAEHTAVAEVRALLLPLFDVDALFAQAGSQRHPMLVNCVGHMTLYHLFCRVNPASVPALRQQRYDHALQWLRQGVAGELQPGFPPRQEPGQPPVLDVRTGGLDKRDLSGF
ncbi:MAG: DUF1320 family protein [Bacteroidetes bacterium]|nr:DUF1320 family protein [Bacteroidota bacterium]